VKLVAESGLWTTGPQVAEPPSVAVLEVAGAVLEWTVTDAPDAPRITFTDVAAADWLWRLVGSDGHAQLAGVAENPAPDGALVEIGDLRVAPEPLAALRRLAFGHWLRRWWPASRRDGIEELDAALLDAEIAVLTADLQEYFSQNTFDSDITGLLTPHRMALAQTVRGGDPRTIDLIRAAAAVADDLGVGDWSEVLGKQGDSPTMRQDDYALVAGRTADDVADAIARGVSTVCWTAVPPRIFDAGEDTVEWAVRGSGSAAVAEVRVATLGSAAGLPLRLDSDAITGRAVLAADGSATVQLIDADGAPVTEDRAWAHHWAGTRVSVGAPVTEPETVREDVRALARRRLAAPGPDSFLAEILAAEADY